METNYLSQFVQSEEFAKLAPTERPQQIESFKGMSPDDQAAVVRELKPFGSAQAPDVFPNPMERLLNSVEWDGMSREQRQMKAREFQALSMDDQNAVAAQLTLRTPSTIEKIAGTMEPLKETMPKTAQDIAAYGGVKAVESLPRLGVIVGGAATGALVGGRVHPLYGTIGGALLGGIGGATGYNLIPGQ